MDGLRVTKNPSRNEKLTGGKDVPFYATYRTVGHSCPTSCPLLNAGCYAQSGHTALQMRGRHSETDGEIFLRELDRIPHGAWMRLHVSGDVMTDAGPDGSSEVDWPYLEALIEGARRRPDVTFYGYTHAWKQIGVLPPAPSNFVLNASVDDPADMDEAKSLGWETTVVVASDVTWKRQGDTVVCPNQTAGLSCYECGLCMRERPVTVAFKAHGSGKRKVDERVALPTA